MSSPTRSELSFFSTPPHRCSYLPDRQAVTVFADPQQRKHTGLYSQLSAVGFRRSGEHLYIPACRECQACVAVRVAVEEFAPRRRQRRVLARNAEVRVIGREPEFDEAHFQLYSRYVGIRHRGGGMDNPSRADYLQFLSSSWSNTVFYEMRRGTELLGVAVTDHLSNGLSAVYTFFDPARTRDSLGVFAILWQIDEARRLGRRWLYLGYWIEAAAKMRYKADYLPQERLVGGRWRRFEGT